MVVNNPNNWHWVDKNCLPWAKDYFSNKLVGISADIDGPTPSTAEINKVTSVEGDVIVSQRKGKIISLFDVKLALGFVGKINGAEAKGSITVPEVAYDTEEDEYQFEISVFSESSENSGIREVLRQKIVPQLRKAIVQFGKDLMTTHGQDIQVSADKVTSQFTKANQEQSLKVSAEKQTSASSSSSAAAAAETTSTTKLSTSSSTSSSNVPKYNTTSLHFEPEFNTTAEQLYITLLEKQRLGHGPAPFQTLAQT